MKNYTVYFSAELYNTDNGPREESGFYPANSLTEAMEAIEAYYGDDIVSITHLELMDTPMMTMSKDIAESIMESYWG